MGRQYTIGRDEGSNVRLDHPSVSRLHALVRVVDGGLEVLDQGSSNGTFLVKGAEREPVMSAYVWDEDVLCFGEIVLAVATLKQQVQAHEGNATAELTPPGAEQLERYDAAPTESRESEPATLVDMVRSPRRPTQLGAPCPRCGLSVEMGARVCPHCDCELAGPAEAQRWIFGRDHEADLQHRDPSLSPQHLAIRVGVDQLFVTDLGSRQGTRFGADRAVLRPGVETAIPLDAELIIGELSLRAADLYNHLRELIRGGRASTVQIPPDATDVVVGRDPDCDVVLPDPQVSRQHARFVREGDAWRVQDLGSSNGTWLAGQRVSDELVRGSAVVGIGSWELKIAPAALSAEGLQGRIRLDVEGASKLVDRDRKKILNDVSFSVLPGELVSIMGPSGAGKTTLLLCLSANDVASVGDVRINGLSLAQQFARYQGLIGYVPQDDIVHAELTVHDALYFYAQLRLPPDTSRDEIEQRIDRVLNELQLGAQKQLRIGSPREKLLSGGQRRRVNLAMELVTEPLILFADEPTSGLSSEDSKEVIAALRREADKGRPVVVTIHQPSARLYRQFDLSMVLGEGGHLVFFGPPEPDAYRFFEATAGDPEALMERLKSKDPRVWVEDFAGSEQHERFVRERQQWQDAPLPQPPQERLQPRGWHAIRILCARLARIKGAGLKSWLRYLLPPLVILALLAAAYGGITDPSQKIGKRAEPIFFLVMGAIFFGLFNAATEIVAERPIYRRERMAGMTIGSYLASKFLVLGVITSLQAVLLGLPVILLLNLSAATWALLVSLAAVGIASVALGLLLSALVPRAEVAMNLVPIVLIAQLLLSGFLSPVRTLPKRIVAAPMVSYWGADMVFTAERAGLQRRLDLRCEESALLGAAQAKLRSKYLTKGTLHLRQLHPVPTVAQEAAACRKAWDVYLGRKHKESRGYFMSSLAIGGLGLAAQVLFFFLLTFWILRLQDPPILKQSRT